MNSFIHVNIDFVRLTSGCEDYEERIHISFSKDFDPFHHSINVCSSIWFFSDNELFDNFILLLQSIEEYTTSDITFYPCKLYIQLLHVVFPFYSV